MKKHLRRLTVFLILTVVVAGCVSPVGTGETQPSSSDQVATKVPPTLPAPTPEVIDTPTSVPEAATSPGAVTPGGTTSLPRTFYYLGTDHAGITQVFRLERDGTTRRQLTFEPGNVTDYDVSLADGSVSYVSYSQLLLINADGSDRRMVADADAGIIVRSPVFSPDGQMLAYGYKGLNLYNVSTGTSRLVIEDQMEETNTGSRLAMELYWPERYSPDGMKLLITLGFYEGTSSAIYYPASNSLVRLIGGERAGICCEVTEWSADGSSFYAAKASMDMFDSGMWRVDANTGMVTTLFASNYASESFVYAGEPYLAPDGQLYFFFLAGTRKFYDGHAPLQPVRSAPDGVTNRTVLRPDTFERMNEALWAPDASFVVVAYAPIQDVYQGGQAEIVYLDGRRNVVLAPSAQQMKWGP
jgi:WD40-like Beta Propeller Repeat